MNQKTRQIIDFLFAIITAINLLGFMTLLIPSQYFLGILAVCALYTFLIRKHLLKKEKK